jgi:hypothetical protein
VRAIVSMLVLLLLLLTSTPLRADLQRELWLYYPVNLQVNENIPKLEPVWRKAKQAGYTHVLIADSKFAKLGDVPENYFKNIERVKTIAKELDLKLVPALFSVGYSNDLLWHDPNLAEGFPVKDTPFVVGPDGVAHVAPEPKVALDKPTWKDDMVKLDGNVATVTTGPGNARLVFHLAVPKYRCYHVSVKVKTDDFRPHSEVKALGGPWTLSWANLGVKPTQDWTEHHVVFNTLDNAEVNLYFGVWGDSKGTLRWKDWKIEEVGLLNVLRRPGTPCVVAGSDGKVYEEGKDYEPIKDPRGGTVPWPGEFDVWHEPPVLKTKLPQGTKLRVSWYHALTVYDGQVSACIAEPKLNDLLADQAKRMKQAWGESAAGWMMSHDEFRTLGWCKACQDRHQTPGQMLAANVRFCRGLLRPDTAYVWNDMFDPYHNAVAGPYYLVNGPWTGSWEGLDKDVVIMNWNHGQRDKSLKFFADRGHKQVVATYYDDDDLGQTRDWIKSTRDDRSVIGYMYTTWRGDYSKVEEFAKVCQGK